MASPEAVKPPGSQQVPAAPTPEAPYAHGRSRWTWARAAEARTGKSPATVWQHASRHAVVMATVLTTTGCWATNPAATTMDHSPADGIQEQLGEVELHNVLIVAAAADQEGRVLGTLVNNGDQELTLSMDAAGATAEVLIPAQGSVELEDSTPLLLDRAGAGPGLMVDTEFIAADQSLATAVPVLDGTLPYYAPYLPSGAPSTPANPSNAPEPLDEKVGQEDEQ